MKYFGLIFLLSVSTVLNGQTTRLLSASTAADSQKYIVLVQDYEAFQSHLRECNIHITGAYRPANVLAIYTTPAVFEQKIRQYPGLLAVTTISSPPSAELSVPGHNIFVNRIHLAQTRFPQWNGKGSVISIREFRFDTNDIDLRNRVLPSGNALDQQTTHASLMATLAAGAGNSDIEARGAAPGSAVISSSFGELLPEEDYQSQGITVQNHSYGTDIENFYGVNAYAYDASARENPHLLQVFSAGNVGAVTSTSGEYIGIMGFANLTGNYKMAKNALVVGALDSMAELTFFSSRGPAYDGRVKPDLVAFGHDGTSGAAALVSGAAAVLQQSYRELYDSLPGSDMLRAVLVHSAEDPAPPGPDYGYGYGRLNLKKAVEVVQSHQLVSGAVADGAVFSSTINVPAAARNLKITLCWNDRPALPLSAIALINNLDLQITDPAGNVWLPWTLSSFPSADSLALPAVRGRERLNNLEMISVEFPSPGLYKIEVIGTKVTNLQQSFSLVYGWENDGYFEWNYPVKNAPAVSGKTAILSWNSNIDDPAAKLDWKPAEAQEWIPIDTAIRISAGLRRWIMPDTVAEALLRIRTQAGDFLSDTFLIAGAMRLNVGFNCPDSVGIFWSPQSAEANYQVWALGERYMEPLLQTKDTFVVLDKSLFPQQRFAVSMTGASSGALSRRSPSPDINTQGLNCYQKRFTAELTDEQQCLLTLQIGTTHGLSAIFLEKWEDGDFRPLYAIQPVDGESFEYVDPDLVQGRNAYRARLASSLGDISTDTASIYFTGRGNHLVFPNPVSAGSTLKVLTRDPSGDARFLLYDALGRLILDKLLDDRLVEIPLDWIPPGIYFYQSLENGQVQWGGRVAVGR